VNKKGRNVKTGEGDEKHRLTSAMDITVYIMQMEKVQRDVDRFKNITLRSS
jgi:hypothetical protein